MFPCSRFSNIELSQLISRRTLTWQGLPAEACKLGRRRAGVSRRRVRQALLLLPSSNIRAKFRSGTDFLRSKQIKKQFSFGQPHSRLRTFSTTRRVAKHSIAGQSFARARTVERGSVTRLIWDQRWWLPRLFQQPAAAKRCWLAMRRARRRIMSCGSGRAGVLRAPGGVVLLAKGPTGPQMVGAVEERPTLSEAPKILNHLRNDGTALIGQMNPPS